MINVKKEMEKSKSDEGVYNLKKMKQLYSLNFLVLAIKRSRKSNYFLKWDVIL